ncbi:MAG: hydantoinase B/oxoprolinase family protein [Candidatus Thorarchaeota archaeon]
MIEDPISFEVIKNALISSAREMSQSLRRTAFSPNIKERRDCSCALFDGEGRLVAQSKDIPVHLGAMPMSVKACIKDLDKSLIEGTMALVNDPYSGGSHLPDLTLVAPVFSEGKRVAFAANRAHHADIGGVSPGSMPGLSTSILEEGIIIKPRIIVERNQLSHEAIADILSGTITPDERLGDLSAQVAANHVAGKRLKEAARTFGWPTLLKTFGELYDYSASRMKYALSDFVGEEATFRDVLDSDGAGGWDIPISISLKINEDRVLVDFEETSKQVKGNVNCPIASTLSSVYYVFIALFGQDIPVNEGCWSVIDVEVPKGSLLNPKYPAAVSAGNVETSQRIVDVTLGALAKISPDLVPAASQGTMNNLTIGGFDERKSKPFSFYETIGGGSGAAKGKPGTSGIHTHMTNTLNTPIESLESEYPLMVRKYSIRRETGGNGQWKGGDGIVREIEVLTDKCTISIQSERRNSHPWGINKGEAGEAGKNTLYYGGKVHSLEAKSTVIVPKGTVVRIETPGGGGFGPPPSVDM